MSDAIRLSSITVNCPDARALASFYAEITDGEVTFSHPAWATVITSGGRIDLQTVEGPGRRRFGSIVRPSRLRAAVRGPHGR